MAQNLNFQTEGSGLLVKSSCFCSGAILIYQFIVSSNKAFSKITQMVSF